MGESWFATSKADVFSRRIVGWKAARTMATRLVLDALNMAAWSHGSTSLDELICNSDAGVEAPQFPNCQRTSGSPARRTSELPAHGHEISRWADS